MSLVRDGLVLQWPDTHVPYHHGGAVGRLMSFCHDMEPAQVIFTGDLIDCEAPARWAAGTAEENGRRLQREIDLTKAMLGEYREHHDGETVWLPGNHEARLAKWGRTRGQAVFGLDALTIPALLDFDGFGIGTPGGINEPTKPYPFAPGVVAIHGERLGIKSGYSVTKEMDRIGKSVVMGHCHRLAVIYHSTPARQIWGLEGGHLMNQRKAGYLSYNVANWQMGFGLIEVSNGRSQPYAIPMDGNGSFVFHGQRW